MKMEASTKPAGQYHSSHTDEKDPLYVHKTKWSEEQKELKTRMILVDDSEWADDFQNLKYVGGVDISFIKGDDVNACASLVIMSYPELQVVYQKNQMVKMECPYIPSYLAFREVDHLVKLIEELRDLDASLIPGVILVDGNGLLHPRGFGLACHLGVLTGIPTIGVGKNLFMMDGLETKPIKERVSQECKEKGDCIMLRGTSGTIWGAAMGNCVQCRNPIFISQGHRVALQTAIRLIKTCCIHKIPEPIRAADLGSREYLRKCEEV